MGGIVGIASGVAALLTIPLTGGLSLLAGGAALGLGVTGAATGIGAEIIVNVRERSFIDDAKRILKEDEKGAKELELAISRLEVCIDEIAHAGVKIAFEAGNIGAGAARISSAFATQVVSRFPRAASQLGGAVAKGVSAGIAVVLIPFEIWNIFNNVEGLQCSSEKASMIRTVVEGLKKDLEEKRTLLHYANEI